jgi:hypothetical protein
MWVILLDENIPEEDRESAIAHEVAHARLGHDRLGEMPDDCETQAANLVKEWGFTGKGADAEYCERQSGTRQPD